MRAPPPIDISLTRFGCWRGALAILALGTGAVIAAWLLASADAQPPALRVGVALAAVLALGALLSAARVAAVELGWDGAHWSCAVLDGGRAGPPLPGELTVAIDLGSWLLLRFAAADPQGGRLPVRWLPVQRRGLEPQWHALRCAVHAPMPAREPR